MNNPLNLKTQPLVSKRLSSKNELGKRDRNQIVQITSAANRDEETVPNSAEEEADNGTRNSVPNRLTITSAFLPVHNDDQPKNTKNLAGLMVNDKRNNVTKRQTVLSTDDVAEPLEPIDNISEQNYSTNANRASYFSTIYKYAYNMFRDVIKYNFDVEKELPNIQGQMTILNQKYSNVGNLTDQV